MTSLGIFLIGSGTTAGQNLVPGAHAPPNSPERFASPPPVTHPQ